jgi:hypothetical protein
MARCRVFAYSLTVVVSSLHAARADAPRQGHVDGEPFPVTEKSRKLVALTTSAGHRGLDSAEADYRFGNLDARRVVRSAGRALVVRPPQDDGPVDALSEPYVEMDWEQPAGFTRQLTYRELH